MKKHIMIMLLVCLHIAARGQSIVNLDDIDLSRLPQPTSAKQLRYWFDEDASGVKTTTQLSGTQSIDVASLIDGLHTIHFQVIDNNDDVSCIHSSLFLKYDINESGAVVAQKLMYWFDDETNVKIEEAVSGVQILDASRLTDGLHTINYQIVDSKGILCPPVTSFFMKDIERFVAEGENCITRYRYWQNSNTQNIQSVELDNASNPYQLISLLPMWQEPIHSDCFHFEITDGVPMVYAKNIFHIRFHDAAGVFADGDKPFVDYSVKQEVGNPKLLTSGERETIARPQANEIKWYRLEAEPGDSLQFKLDRACSMQLFAPSGEEIHAVSGAESVDWNGLHVYESGTYYLALHDMTATYGNELNLDYEHIDKYAVLRQDVTTVGNGGCSTITFDGNGFTNLYAVELVKGNTTINHAYLDFISDAKTALTFDFSDVALGDYKAIFHFAEEDRIVENCINVEEATDFEFDCDLSYAPQYLISSNNNYVYTIHNRSNMTAYDVPMVVMIYTPNAETLKRVNVKGFNLRKKYEQLNGGAFPSQIDASIIQREKNSGDLCYFLGMDGTTPLQGLPYLQYSYIKKTLPPNGSEEVIVSVNTSDRVCVLLHYPDEWPEYDENEPDRVQRRVDYQFSDGCMIAKKRWYDCINYKWGYSQGLLDEGVIPPYCNNIQPPTYCLPQPGPYGHSEPVNSLDPNEIYGYLAPSGSNAVKKGLRDVYYTIQFENDPEFATASAHEVFVRDTLDSKRFDLKTFAPTSIRIGDKTVQLDGQPNFVKTIDMRPNIYAIAQVECQYNQQKGIAEWHFSSLDPMTMEPTDDVMQGFLPVNANGNGIGEVSFDIKLKSGLADGAEVSNRAGIVFDQNEVIMTPAWENIIDLYAPESHVTEIIIDTDATALVNMEATDNLSGVWKYDVYVQYGEGASWWKEASDVPADQMAKVRYYEDIVTNYLTVAYDMAGNKEFRRELNPDMGDATGIKDNQHESIADGRYYDLQGRRLGKKPQRGAYIKDRKKHVAK